MRLKFSEELVNILSMGDKHPRYNDVINVLLNFGWEEPQESVVTQMATSVDFASYKKEASKSVRKAQKWASNRVQIAKEDRA